MSNASNLVCQAIAKANRTYQDVWSHYPYREIENFNRTRSSDEVRHTPPMQYPCLVWQNSNSLNPADCEEKQLIVFVGLNPSLSDQSHSTLTSYCNPETPYAIANPQDWLEVVDHESEAYSNYAYFKPFRDFSSTHYTLHVDLFALRHTSQACIKDLVTWSKSDTATATFLNEQVCVLTNLLQDLNPAAVVIVNTLVRDILSGTYDHIGCEQFKVERIVNDINEWAKPGQYKCTGIVELASMPIHASGMLSGQRALDIDSRDRLIAEVHRSIQPNNQSR